MLPKVQSEKVHHVGAENVVEKAHDGPDESGGMFDDKGEDLALDRQVEAQDLGANFDDELDRLLDNHPQELESIAGELDSNIHSLTNPRFSLWLDRCTLLVGVSSTAIPLNKCRFGSNGR